MKARHLGKQIKVESSSNCGWEVRGWAVGRLGGQRRDSTQFSATEAAAADSERRLVRNETTRRHLQRVWKATWRLRNWQPHRTGLSSPHFEGAIRVKSGQFQPSQPQCLIARLRVSSLVARSAFHIFFDCVSCILRSIVQRQSPLVKQLANCFTAFVEICCLLPLRPTSSRSTFEHLPTTFAPEH